MNFISIDKDKCNQDGICISVCPLNILYMDEQLNYPVPINGFGDYCIKCGHCVAVCPKGAFNLNWLKPEDCKPIKKELAATPEQIEQLLSAGRSNRTYKEQTVPRNVLEKLLEIGCTAPSARNMQPWHWLIIQKPSEVKQFASMVIDWMRLVIQEKPETKEAKQFLYPVTLWDKGIDIICRGAPHLIIVHADKEWDYKTEDCVSALSYIDLYATSIGLGTCWGGFFYTAVNEYPPLFEALGLPSDHIACGARMVGYPRYKYHRIPTRNRPKSIWR